MFNNDNIIETQNTPLVIKELPLIIKKIPLIVISLDRATERREYIKKILSHKFSFFKAVDGINLQEEDVLLKKIYMCSDTQLRDGQIGCFLSHIKLWINIYEKSSTIVHLILEDDIVFKYNIHKILNVINKIDFNDYDIIFLGHCFEGIGELKQEIIDELKYFNLHSSQTPRCTHAYLITKNGAKKALDYISSINNTENKIDGAIDEVISILVGRGIIKSLSFHDTLINQPWQEPVNTLNLGSYTGSN
jgi:GR25 family glycosyltransferase involved in LPS biosynthesis